MSRNRAWSFSASASPLPQASRKISLTEEDILNDMRRSLLEKDDVPPQTQKVGDALKVVVFGGLDGIITIFTVVAGSVGANLTPMQIFVVSVGNLIGDAIAMGFGEYTSSKAEDDYVEQQRKKELWEIENVPHVEKAEMMEIYINKHQFAPHDALAMIELVTKYPDFYLSHMMMEELGLMSDPGGLNSLERGGIMAASFAVFGALPLIGFMLYTFVASHYALEHTNLIGFIVSALLSLTSLFFLGTAKSYFVGGLSVWPGLQMILNGSIAGSFAYGFGILFSVFYDMS